MPEPILIRYRAEGVPELSKAFDTVERRIVSLNAASARGRTTREAAAKGEAATVLAAKSAEEKAVEKAEKEKTRQVELEAKRRSGIVDRSALMAGKLAAAQVKEEEKALADGTRALDREMRARERIRDRSAMMAGKFAEHEANAEIAARKRIGTTIGGSVMSGTGRVLGGIVSMGGMALGAAGAFGVADAVRGRFRAEETAAQIVNAVTQGGDAHGATVAGILDKASGTAVTTGMSKDDIIKGTLAYTRSARGGDFAGAMGNMDFFAKLSKTTGTDISELGSAAGKLQSQNPNLDAKGMQQMLLNAYEMSKSGSVSLGEAVGQIGTLASTRGFYQGDTAVNQRKLFALGQIAASGGASGDIGTYIKDVSIEVAAKRRHTAKELGFGSRGVEALGVHFDKFGAMESPEQMIGAIFKATGGDMSKIHGIVGNRGLPLFTELQKSFQGAGGGDAGVAAVKAQIGSVAGASMSSEQLDAQFAQVMGTSSEKFSVAIEKIRVAMEDKAVPFIDKFAEKLGDPAFEKNVDGLIEAVGQVANFFFKNPFAGIGTVVLAAIMKDLGAAMIGQAVKSAMVRVAAGESIPKAFGTGGTGGMFGLVGGAVAGAAGVVDAFTTVSADKAASEKRVKGILAWNPQNDNERATKAALLKQMIASGDKGAGKDIEAYAGLPVSLGVNRVTKAFGGRDDVTGAEAAVARAEDVKAIKAHTAELLKQIKLLSDAGSNITNSQHPSRTVPISARPDPHSPT